jgi:murein hydrolase activator
MRFLLITITALAILIHSSAFSDDKARKQQELSKLKQRIEKLRQTIEAKENSKSSYSKQLRNIEKKIGKVSREINRSEKALRSKQQSLNALKKNKSRIQQSIQQQNQHLAQQLHSAYTLGQQEQIKLLFSQKNAAQLQRNLTYYQYFTRYRLDLIDSAQINVQKLTANELLIQQASKELENILSGLKNKKATLTQDSRKRKTIIASLEKELRKQGKNLNQLEENAKNLTQLIDSLSEILTDIPTPPAANTKFFKLKGKLAWPVKGNVRKLFGRKKPPSNLRWQGVVIKAPEGNNVRAVSHGRVAFADWLRGMGNLIIIDHGDGYLSLYGHNQSLFKSAGEWVEAGDIIGSIGNSGGQNQPGLYFEIRKKGKPLNPSRWCNSRNWFAT